MHDFDHTNHYLEYMRMMVLYAQTRAAAGLVSGKNRTTFNQMIRLDIEYSERASFWLDVKIILKTLPALWTQCVETRVTRREQSTQKGKAIYFNNL